MATIIRETIKAYHYVNEDLADPRSKDWFLMGSPWPTIGIIFAYHYFVQVLGPQYMANKKPYNLKRVLQIYNISQVLISAYVVYQALTLCWLVDYDFRCQPIDYSTNPRAVAIARAVWLYFIVKIVDFLDTIFFVLRKKTNQVTFLHLYHHTGMVVGGWIVVKYLAGGHMTFLGSINSFVHVIMYSYYYLTSLNIGQPWWKKHITQIQLIQFLLITYHFTQLIWVKNCGFPLWPIALLIPQNFFMLALFSDFYYKVYIRKQPAKVETKGVKDATSSANETAKNDESKSR